MMMGFPLLLVFCYHPQYIKQPLAALLFRLGALVDVRKHLHIMEP